MLSSSAREYKEALSILASSSEHINLIVQAIKEQILPNLANKNSMIDVGAGMGVLTSYLESEFKNITVVDINPKVKKELQLRPYEVVIANFLEYVTDNKFDFVLCTHVMYHYNEQQMREFILKLLSLVNTGGYCFIALIAPRGKNHQFHTKFNENYVNSTQIINILDKEKIDYKRINATPHQLHTHNAYAMRSLLKFFLIENCLTKPSSSLHEEELQNINTIIDKEIKNSKIAGSEDYEFEQEDDYFIIPRIT
jgi:SAM-dependent methyltransferase